MNSQQTLKEFKSFCKKNILQNLQKAERERKQVLVAVIISSLIFLLVVNSLNQLFYVNVFSPETYVIIYINNSTISFPAFLLTKVFFLLTYLVFFLGLFLLWSLFYNSAFESFSSGLEKQVNEKIFEFINISKNLNLFTKPIDIDIDETLHSIQHSQMFNGLFKPNSIKRYHHISGYVNNIIINITQVDIQSGVNHHWTKIFNISTDVFQASSKNAISLEEIITVLLERIIILLKIFLLFIPKILLVILTLIKGFPYVFKRVAQGKNIDYQRFEVEILKNQAFNHTIFRGLFFRAKLNKFARFLTVVSPNILKANISSTISHGNKQLVKLEDPEFVKYFIVYSEDQVNARYILSTNLMEKLVDFRQKAKKNIYASFVEDTIYFAIEYPDGLFEANLYRSMLSFAPLREYFEAIQLMLGLVEELNLDREIWKSDDV